MVTGAGGMLGRRLVARLLRAGAIGAQQIAWVTATDIIASTGEIEDSRLMFVRADLSDARDARALIARRPNIIFHLAAVVSGEAERDIDKGYRVNLAGGTNLLEAIRRERERDYTPRLIFGSSIAVFGPPFPKVIDDDCAPSPRTSYGTQKAALELLLADHARRGLVDAVGLRLPTICIRPGAPNAAASGFISSIIREPLAGRNAVLPVPASTRYWIAGPDAAVGFLLHAATLDTSALGHARMMNMPGLSVSAGEQIEALRSIAGSGTVARIKQALDPDIIDMVRGWPSEFAPARALALGFEAEKRIEDIITAHMREG